MTRKTINIDLNRVEGDLEFALEVEDGVVVEARASGTLFRGFEQILTGRAPRDAMVITPRVCGICGTAHLYSAVLALENIWNTPVPPNAVRIRNLCLMAEGVQNDLRQSYLFFSPDFCNEIYRDHPMYEEVIAAFAPFEGRIYREALEYTKRAVEVVAIFGGQWPHSSYMLPGGVVTAPTQRRIFESRTLIEQQRRWYQDSIIGGDLEEWLALDSADALFAWLESDPRHAASAVGLLTRFARSIGLHKIGLGTPHMISYGAYRDPEGDGLLVNDGFYDGEQGEVQDLDQGLINEHVRHSWFRPYAGGRHPFQGETVPDYQPGSDRYTWAKAPRYGDHVVQTGPLAERLIGGDPLIASLHSAEGGNAWLRQFARIRRTGFTLMQMRDTLDELEQNLDQPHFLLPPSGSEEDGEGYGLVMAARGALGHWVRLRDGVVERYQIITPTAWNASPRDSEGRPGHWELSLEGLRVEDPDNPVEIGHVIRSHDPCLVCTVHLLDTDRRHNYRP